MSKSLSVEKSHFSLPFLINALFYDLATEKDFKIPTQQNGRFVEPACSGPNGTENQHANFVQIPWPK